MTTTKFATSSTEEALTADIRICWCGAAPSNGGTIFQTRPRKRLCGSGARRTGSNSARPEVTLLLSTGGLLESAGNAESVQLLAQSCTDPSHKGGLRNTMGMAELKVRIHSPPAERVSN